MAYIIGMFIILSVLFIGATKLVEQIYNSGHQINSFLIGGLSFVILIIGQILFKNQIIMYPIQILFLFGSIVFFMTATRNYKLLMSGEGKGWLAKRVRRLKEASKKNK